MPSRDASICTKIVRRSVFFNEDFGIIWRGNVVPGIAPISAVLENTQDLDSAISSADSDLKKELLSRVFVLYNTKPENVKKRVGSLTKKTRFSARLICLKNESWGLSNACINDALLLRPDSVLPRDILLILYVQGLSEHSLQTQRTLLSKPHTRKEIIGLIAKRIRNVSFSRPEPNDNNILCVARYQPEQKPLLHKVLDSMLYMERRELLTRQELILRYVSTVLLFPTIIAPLVCLIMALGQRHSKRRCPTNLTRWQYYQHQEKHAALQSVVALLKDKSARTEMYRDALIQLLIERGYLDSTENATPLGKRTRDRHNLMLTTAGSLLNKKQIVIRCLLWTAVTLALVSAIAYFVLIFAPFVNAARAFTAFAIAATSSLFASGILAFHIRNQTALCVVVGSIAVAGICLATISAVYSISGKPPISLNTISAITALIAVCAIAITGLACAENFILHKNDRVAANHLGLSLTAYLDIKPYMKAELRKYSDEHITVTASLNALRTGGADIEPLLNSPSIEPFSSQSETPSTRIA